MWVVGGGCDVIFHRNYIVRRKRKREGLGRVFHKRKIRKSFATSFAASLGRRRKILVMAGHVTTQNLDGKRNLLGGRGGRVFLFFAVVNFVGFKTSSSR